MRCTLRWMASVVLAVLVGATSLPVAANESLRADCRSCALSIDNLDQPLYLGGKWLFTRDDRPQNKNVGIDTASWVLATTPGTWNSVYGDNKTYQVGWYRAELDFNPTLIGREVSLTVNTNFAPTTVYLDGAEIFSRPGQSNLSPFYPGQPLPVHFTVNSLHHTLAIRVNSVAMTGIYQTPFEIKAFSAYDQPLAWSYFFNGDFRSLLGAMALGFGLFFVLVYGMTYERMYAVAALQSLSLALFFLMLSEFAYRFFPNTELLLWAFPGVLANSYFGFVFSQFFFKFRLRLNWAFGAICAIVLLGQFLPAIHVLNLDAFYKTRGPFMLLVLVLVILAAWNFLQGLRQRKLGAGVLLLGALAMLVAFLHDALIASGRLVGVFWMNAGISVSTAAMMLVSCILFAKTFVENKRLVNDLKGLNDSLEETVAQRTAELRQKSNDIQTMLQNMPQGILTITAGGIVHPEYSAYLETIFETKDIAGRHFMDLLFGNASLGTDMLSQVAAVEGACIGEDHMNFEFNAHLMVREFDKTLPSGITKALELSWSPICDPDGVIEKLMICVRDVTELKALAAEAGQQKRELEIIGQVLAVNQEKFHEFVDSANDFIDENTKIIRNAALKQIDTIGQLFRNMHTIKGNARTYGLLHLTNTVHEAEQAYDQLRKSDEAQWHPELLLADLQEVKRLVDEYAHINNVKLGRNGPGRRGSVEKYLMVENDRIAAAIRLIDGAGNIDAQTAGSVLRTVRKTLALIGTESIKEILAGVIDSMPSLAKDLGKLPPTIVIEDNGLMIKSQIGGLLKNLFTHLYRNAIDHGIESPEQRRILGKPEVGTIALNMSLSDGRLHLRLRDDGRGVALAKVLERGRERGLVGHGDTPDDEAIALLLFRSGFSTAEKVTEVSGRGVGLDAVKGFIEREGGDVCIVFTASRGADGNRPCEFDVSLPGNFAVASGDFDVGLPENFAAAQVELAA